MNITNSNIKEQSKSRLPKDQINTRLNKKKEIKPKSARGKEKKVFEPFCGIDKCQKGGKIKENSGLTEVNTEWSEKDSESSEEILFTPLNDQKFIQVWWLWKGKNGFCCFGRCLKGPWVDKKK